MKNQKNIRNPYPFLLTLTLSLFFLAAQNLSAQGDTPHPIVGTWTFDASTFETRMDPGAKQRLDTLPAQKNAIRAFYIGRTESFAPDGSYLISLADGSTLVGHWAAQNNNIVQITTPDGSVFRKRISFPVPNRLVMVNIASGDTKSIITETYFIKN
ncbi:hypothetical protein [Spongiimicrobium sp. 2-473A-2-J]|uniref:hypothetical protein n=1 Tax=Eudoraea algarum TaxID=3417568 RepID=UPI003D3620AE